MMAALSALAPACDAAGLTSSSSKSNTAILMGAALSEAGASAASAASGDTKTTPSHARPMLPMNEARRLPVMCNKMLLLIRGRQPQKPRDSRFLGLCRILLDYCLAMQLRMEIGCLRAAKLKHVARSMMKLNASCAPARA